jgi:hypothetical protein
VPLRCARIRRNTLRPVSKIPEWVALFLVSSRWYCLRLRAPDMEAHTPGLYKADVSAPSLLLVTFFSHSFGMNKDRW